MLAIIKKDKFIILSLYILYCLITLPFISQIITLSHDSVYYYCDIKEMNFIFHPHHLLHNPLSILWFKLLNFLNIQDEVFASASINVFFGAGVVSLVYIYLRKDFAKSYAFIASIMIGTTFGFWFYNTVIEVYIMPMLFLIWAITYIKYNNIESNKSIIFLGLISGLAVLFHQIYSLLGLVIFFYILINSKRKIIDSLLYAIVFNLIWIIVYALVVYYSFDNLSFSNISYWFTLYNHEVTDAWNKFDSKFLFRPMAGIGRVFLNYYPLFINEEITKSVYKLFPNNMLQAEVYMMKDIPQYIFYIYSLLSMIFHSILIYLLFKFIINIKILLKNEFVGFFFLIIISLFFLFWVPTNLEFWIAQSILFLLICTSLPIKRIIIYILIVINIVVNLGLGLIFTSDRDKDIYFIEIDGVNSILNKELTLVYKDYEFNENNYIRMYDNLDVGSDSTLKSKYVFILFEPHLKEKYNLIKEPIDSLIIFDRPYYLIKNQ